MGIILSTVRGFLTAEGVSRVQWEDISTAGDITSTAEVHIECNGGCSVQRRDTMCVGGYHDAYAGYREYT